MLKTHYTIDQNLIIKKPVPAVGIICSNPRRVERIVKSHLSHAVHLKEYNTAWQLDIYVGSYQGKHFFVAAVPVGAAGAAYAIQQLATAGARYIIRYGSNDDPHLTPERMDEVILVDQADNLYGLMQGSGAPKETWGEVLNASDILVTALQNKASAMQLATCLAICHHVEDYSAYAFPEHAGEYGNNVMANLRQLEAGSPSKLHCRDMESAALFFRANLDNFHAATVLQNVPKFAGQHQTYDGEQGAIAKRKEEKFCDFIFETLADFAEEYVPDFRTYTLLTVNLIPAYLKSIGGLEFFSEPSELEIKEIGDGNLNHVFRVKNTKTNKTLIIKQALPYLRCVGEDHLLTIHRMRYEIRYMHRAATITPDYLPTLYYADSESMMVLIMQDLDNCLVMRDGLSKKIRYKNFTQQISHFLANNLFFTSRLYLNQKDHADLVEAFHHNELCSLTENYIFTFPYLKHDSNYLSDAYTSFSPLFRKNAYDLLQIFSTRTEALIHADLHTGSIMLNQNEMFVIDSEFAFMGPMAFDLGLLLANLITAWVSHQVHHSDSDFQDELLTTMIDFINRFNTEFSLLWQQHRNHMVQSYFTEIEFSTYQQSYLKNIFQETIGYAGLELCRRVCGIAGVKEIRGIVNDKTKQLAEKWVLSIGLAWVENYKQYDSIEAVIEKMKNETLPLAEFSASLPVGC